MQLQLRTIGFSFIIIAERIPMKLRCTGNTTRSLIRKINSQVNKYGTRLTLDNISTDYWSASKEGSVYGSNSAKNKNNNRPFIRFENQSPLNGSNKSLLKKAPHNLLSNREDSSLSTLRTQLMKYRRITLDHGPPVPREVQTTRAKYITRDNRDHNGYSNALGRFRDLKNGYSTYR